MADGIISFWAPVQIQSVLGSSVVMGLIISFQSVVGLIADLVFSKLLRNVRARGLIFWGIMMSGFTSFFLVNTIFWPFVSIFLVTMALWGIYYELISFASYQFMEGSVPPHMRSSAWGVAGMFLNLAYFLGPLLASYLIYRGYVITEVAIILFLIAALVLLLITEKVHDIPVKVDLAEVNLGLEIRHWLTLGRVVWPAIVISLLLGFIDSTFWTTGAVYTEKLAGENFWGGLFLPIYQLPGIVTGLIIAKWGVYKGKKILSEKMLILAGLFLIALMLNGTIAWQLSMVLMSSIAVSISYPLIEGVYSDIVARMGREKKEMIGLTNSMVNISYIIAPPITGLISSKVGERMTFGIVGAMVVVVSVLLLLVTPKKLRLPQVIIKNWD